NHQLTLHWKHRDPRTHFSDVAFRGSDTLVAKRLTLDKRNQDKTKCMLATWSCDSSLPTTYNHPVRGLADGMLSPRGLLLAEIDGPGILIEELETALHPCRLESDPRFHLKALTISHEDKLLATIDEIGRVQLWPLWRLT